MLSNVNLVKIESIYRKYTIKNKNKKTPMKNGHKKERKIQAKKLTVNQKRIQRLHQRIRLESIGF